MATRCASLASRSLATAERDSAARADVEKFQSLYQKHVGRVYYYVYGWVSNREEAEDLTAEIFLKAVRGVNYEHSAEEIQHWLFQVARTTLNDYWRARYHLSTCSLDELFNSDWEDAVQEERQAMHSKPAAHVRPYLDRLSTRSPEELLEIGWEALEVEGTTTANARTADRVERLLQALPQRYREVLTCRFLHNLSLKDTALQMGITLSNVKVLQYRALKRAAEFEHLVTD
jgi:RNA polymerase sigma-70 factor (ECF subfamily)